MIQKPLRDVQHVAENLVDGGRIANVDTLMDAVLAKEHDDEHKKRKHEDKEEVQNKRRKIEEEVAAECVRIGLLVDGLMSSSNLLFSTALQKICFVGNFRNNEGALVPW